MDSIQQVHYLLIEITNENVCYSVEIYCFDRRCSNEKWKKYQNSKIGQHDFQIDLGILLINYGVELEQVGDN